MVKGISRRVVIVKAPIGSIFEEAIFILRDDALSSDIDAEKILKEACVEADEYVRINCSQKKKTFLIPSLIIACLISLLLLFLFIFLL